MALTSSSGSSLSSTSLLKPLHHHDLHKPTPFSLIPTNSGRPKCKTTINISAVLPDAADLPCRNPPPNKWTPDSWKLKKASQLPEYPDKAELESVLRTLESFPPIVFAGEARKLEERLGQAAIGDAFLLQGGDCAESFKEFNANNIRDTFRVLLQMGVVLMFGGQMPVIKGGRIVIQIDKDKRTNVFEQGLWGKDSPRFSIFPSSI